MVVTKRTLKKSRTHDKKLHPMDAGSTVRTKQVPQPRGTPYTGGGEGGSSRHNAIDINRLTTVTDTGYKTLKSNARTPKVTFHISRLL